MQTDTIATPNDSANAKKYLGKGCYAMSIMNDRRERVAQVHGMLWPRYLFQEEAPSSSSILQRRRRGGGDMKGSSKRVPHKVRQEVSFQQWKETERTIRSLSKQLKDIGNSTCLLPSTFSPVDVKVSSPSFTKNLTTLTPTSTNNLGIPSLVPEHSYYWGRAGQYGSPASVSAKKWSRITPVKPSGASQPQQCSDPTAKRRKTKETSNITTNE